MAAETFARLLFGFLFQVIPFGILAMYPFWNRLRTSPKKTTALIALAVAGVGTVFATAGCYLQGLLPGDATLFNAVNAIFLACLVPCLALYLVLVRGTWQEKLFVFDFALTCAWGITATTDIVFTVTHKDGPFDGLPYQGWTPLLLLALGAVTVPVLMLLLKRNYLPVRDGISWKQSTVLALLSAALFIMLASIFVATAFTDAANPLTMTLFVAVLAMVFAVYAAMLALLRAGAERLDAQRKGDRAEHMLQLQSRQIKAMDDARRHDRRMRHDMRHALAAIRSLVTQGDSDAALEFLDEYMDGMASDGITRYCGNEAVNAVASHYAKVAEENGVRFEMHASLGGSAAAGNAELCVVLGNLLDNAVFAASHGDGEQPRWVRAGLASSGDAVAITVDNSFDGCVEQEGNAYRSTKRGHAGLGIESVRFAAERHGGAAAFSHDGTTFHASVMLGGPSAFAD